MSLNESQIMSENGENRKILLHDRNQRYCREHSQKLHTNEKLHASERLWSESHFRLVFFQMEHPVYKVGNRETSFHHCAFSNQSFEKYVDVYVPCN